MTIRRDGGEFECECDDCGDKFYGGTAEDFMEFVEEIESDGWWIRKSGDDWIHICPTCAGET